MKKSILVCAILLLSTSGHTECPSADLTGDCFVDLADLAVMASQWEGEPNMPLLYDMASQWMTEGIRDIVFVDIPSGTFQMGDSFDEGGSSELPVHTVTLSSFKMSKYEITNQQYCDYLNSAYPAQLKVVDGYVYASSDDTNSTRYCITTTSSSQTTCRIVWNSINFSVSQGYEDHPMTYVSRYGAEAYCDYYGYSLPTEAQWEYAARGGLAGARYPWGDNIDFSLANYAESIGATTPVGSYAAGANNYGLYDMAGNVLEWCSDRYSSSYYSSSPSTNPTGPTTGNYRVLRGGSFSSIANRCRVANRSSYSWYYIHYAFGFRVCLDLN